MRMSCNGCRILRKGCNDDCVLRPCLEWIKSPESQANATVFLAKFYGRAGLVKLISAAPLQHRTAIFRSLLYEACGRIINPTYGAVGLMWSGSWEQCQSAVESVLNGSAIIQLPSDHTSDGNAPMARSITALNGNCDIRHLNKGPRGVHHSGGGRKGSKRSSSGKARKEHITTTTITTDNPHEPVAKFSITGWNWGGHHDQKGADDHHQVMNYGAVSNGSSYARSVEPMLVHSDDQGVETCTSEDSEELLELTLGWNHATHSHRS